MRKTILAILTGFVLTISSCATFNINEAASFSHKCASKHAKRLHMYQGKFYFNWVETFSKQIRITIKNKEHETIWNFNRNHYYLCGIPICLLGSGKCKFANPPQWILRHNSFGYNRCPHFHLGRFICLGFCCGFEFGRFKHIFKRLKIVRAELALLFGLRLKHWLRCVKRRYVSSADRTLPLGVETLGSNPAHIHFFLKHFSFLFV